MMNTLDVRHVLGLVVSFAFFWSTLIFLTDNTLVIGILATLGGILVQAIVEYTSKEQEEREASEYDNKPLPPEPLEVEDIAPSQSEDKDLTNLDKDLKDLDKELKDLDKDLKEGEGANKEMDLDLNRDYHPSKELDEDVKEREQSIKELDKDLKEGDQANEELDKDVKADYLNLDSEKEFKEVISEIVHQAPSDTVPPLPAETNSEVIDDEDLSTDAQTDNGDDELKQEMLESAMVHHLIPDASLLTSKTDIDEQHQDVSDLVDPSSLPSSTPAHLVPQVEPQSQFDDAPSTEMFEASSNILDRARIDEDFDNDLERGKKVDQGSDEKPVFKKMLSDSNDPISTNEVAEMESQHVRQQEVGEPHPDVQSTQRSDAPSSDEINVHILDNLESKKIANDQLVSTEDVCHPTDTKETEPHVIVEDKKGLEKTIDLEEAFADNDLTSSRDDPLRSSQKLLEEQQQGSSFEENKSYFDNIEPPSDMSGLNDELTTAITPKESVGEVDLFAQTDGKEDTKVVVGGDHEASPADDAEPQAASLVDLSEPLVITAKESHSDNLEAIQPISNNTQSSSNQMIIDAQLDEPQLSDLTDRRDHLLLESEIPTDLSAPISTSDLQETLKVKEEISEPSKRDVGWDEKPNSNTAQIDEVGDLHHESPLTSETIGESEKPEESQASNKLSAEDVFEAVTKTAANLTLNLGIQENDASKSPENDKEAVSGSEKSQLSSSEMSNKVDEGMNVSSRGGSIGAFLDVMAESGSGKSLDPSADDVSHRAVFGDDNEQDEDDIDEDSGNVAPNPDGNQEFDASDPSVQEAATRIQAAFKGYKVRSATKDMLSPKKSNI